MKLHEMDGFLKGKCLPGDMLVNETNAEYLVRKFAELQSALDVQSARSDALAAENAALKVAIEYCINPNNQPEYHDQGMGCGVEDRGYQRDGYSACYYGWESAMERVYSEVIPDAIPETPATDAWVNEQRAMYRAEGINFAAARLAAAFNHGFVDKPTAEVYDVVKSILEAKEELSSAPEDGLSGEYAEQALNDWTAQLRGSQV